MSSGPSVPTNLQSNIHQIGLTFVWCGLFNIAVLCSIRNNSKISNLIHSIIGWSMLLLTYAFVLLFLIPYGFNIVIAQFSVLLYIHAIIGCTLLGLVVLQVGGGVFGRMYQNNPDSDIFRLRLIKNCHKFMGYFLAVIYKINIIWSWGSGVLFFILILWQIGWIVGLIYIKLFAPSLQKKIIDMQTVKSQCREIQRIDEIQKQTYNYVMFGNYVYDASQLKTLHPGGHKVIQTIIGREVDRFIYGMYSSQLFPQLKPYSHSSNCLKLVGPPIAKLVTPKTFEGFTSEVIEVKVSRLQAISTKTLIYAIGLTSNSAPLVFVGYTDIRQLGQYYSLTVGNEITRLYTAVNFLTQNNIQLLNKLFSGSNFKELHRKTLVNPSNQAQMMKMKAVGGDLLQKNENSEREYLPLMLKVYQNGLLTSSLMNHKFQNISIKLSAPKGRGLQLQSTSPGRIVIVAGGTGLFPFSDFIDLSFKAHLLEQQNPHYQEILNSNPILNSKPFDKFTFVLLIAINEPQDIHPITLQQLRTLSQHQAKFKVVLRVSKNQKELSQFKSNIEFTRQYFTKRVLTEAAVQNFSRVWICGPPKLNSQTAKVLLDNGFKRQSFLLV